jgi:hypothetical protein
LKLNGCWTEVIKQVKYNYTVISAYFFVKCCLEFLSLFFTLGIILVKRKKSLEQTYKVEVVESTPKQSNKA